MQAVQPGSGPYCLRWGRPREPGGAEAGARFPEGGFASTDRPGLDLDEGEPATVVEPNAHRSGTIHKCV